MNIIKLSDLIQANALSFSEMEFIVSKQDLINDLRTQLLVQPIFNEALGQLKQNTEISLLLEHRHPCALFFDGQQVQLEDRPAHQADVEFSLSTDAIFILLKAPTSDMAEFGIAVAKLIVNNEIKVRVLTSSLKVLTKGYLKIIQSAGPDFMKFLAEQGLKNLNKVISTIKSLRR